MAAEQAGRQGEVVHHLMGAFHLEAGLLELADQQAQERVVALARRRNHSRQEQQAAEVRRQAGEIRPRHVAGQADRAAARSPQRLDAFADLGQPHRRPGVGRQAVASEPLQPDHEQRTPGAFAMLRDLHRQAAAAGDQSQLVHQTSRSGRQSGRPASARMKSMISITSGELE
jgi:hypothetical protein